MNDTLSIIIPARREMFLKNTVEDILRNKRGNTEIIVVLDGEWADPPVEQHPDVNVIYLPEAIGQRAATNLGVKLAKGHWIMKLDAHCAMSEGFDVKMMEHIQEDWTMVPTMRNLWTFSWKCDYCGCKWYQGPTPTKCQETNYKKTGKPCPSNKFHRKLMWIAKERPQSNSYCFDSEPHFQYFNEWTKTNTYKEQLKTGFTETMSLQGSCFMCSKKKYEELDLCSEYFPSWGSQGIEVAMKTWLSGGKVMVDHSVFYAHMFRTQGGDFSFPYPQSGNRVQEAKRKAKDLFFSNKWEKQIHPLSYVLDKFWPIKGWDEATLLKLKEDEKINWKK
jgi:glycosyltransferase involved in cell wall biosynthesis